MGCLPITTDGCEAAVDSELVGEAEVEARGGLGGLEGVVKARE